MENQGHPSGVGDGFWTDDDLSCPISTRFAARFFLLSERLFTKETGSDPVFPFLPFYGF